LWIVLKIGVLNDYNLAPGFLKPATQRGALAVVSILKEDTNVILVQGAAAAQQCRGASFTA
jgi:hypothetical protein